MRVVNFLPIVIIASFCGVYLFLLGKHDGLYYIQVYSVDKIIKSVLMLVLAVNCTKIDRKTITWLKAFVYTYIPVMLYAFLPEDIRTAVVPHKTHTYIEAALYFYHCAWLLLAVILFVVYLSNQNETSK